MKPIAFSFTLKNQDVKQIDDRIKLILQSISEINPKDYTIVTGHILDRNILAKMRIDLGFRQVVDIFENYNIPIKCFYNNRDKKPNRTLMANYIAENNGKVFIIGNVIDGVKEELYAYIEAGVPMEDITFIQL